MKIVIFQPMLKFYRVPLFEKLHQLLTDNGHELRLVFGTPWEAEQQRGDNVVVENDYCFFEKSHWFLNNKVHILEGAIGHILWADIVITDQANRHLHNYLLIVLSLFKAKAFGYWGHGENKQGIATSLRERLKKALAIQTDWWFAYTSGVADYLQSLGFSKDRVTVLNNSIDTRTFKKALTDLSVQEIGEFKRLHNIADDAQIGLFCGSLHQDKKIEFLLESALQIKQLNPRFILLIGGAGQDKALVQKYAERYDFIIYLGALHGVEKALAFKCADIFLNPGMVGLAILDAFSARMPLFTTKQAKHSPEIDYLTDGVNGRLSDLTIEDFSTAVLTTLASASLLETMKNNALESSNQFSIENMANNFFEGIQSFIAQPNRAR